MNRKFPTKTEISATENVGQDPIKLRTAVKLLNTVRIFHTERSALDRDVSKISTHSKLCFFAVGNTLVYARTCYGKPANAPGSQCYDDEQAVSYVRYLNCELCRTDGCNAPKNITNDAPSNLSTNGPSNVPTNAPNNVPPTNPPNNSPPTNAPTNAPTNNPNTDKKGDSSDATQFGPIALFCIIPVAVARSFLHQWNQLVFYRRNSEPIAWISTTPLFKHKFVAFTKEKFFTSAFCLDLRSWLRFLFSFVGILLCK